MHNMEMPPALQSLCEGNPLVGSFHKGTAMWSFDVSFVVSLKGYQTSNQGASYLSWHDAHLMPM